MNVAALTTLNTLLCMVHEAPAAGDVIPPECELIEVRVAELKQLFNPIDPSPFQEKDLDAKAEEFIIGWAREVRRDAPLALRVHVDRPPGLAAEASILREAIHAYFTQRSVASKRRLRQLFRVGRTSLLIGFAFLAVIVVLGGLIEGALEGRRLGVILRESVLIGGWVAMWRPLEIFLYDWWPIRADRKLFDRLSAMPIRIVYAGGASADAWRQDWPAVQARQGAHEGTSVQPQ